MRCWRAINFTRKRWLCIPVGWSLARSFLTQVVRRAPPHPPTPCQSIYLMPTELVVLDSAAQTRQKSYIAIFACFLNISSSSQLKAFSQPLLKVKETSYCSAVMYVMMGVRETRPRLQTGRPVHTQVTTAPGEIPWQAATLIGRISLSTRIAPNLD